ncbi:hypothetical protein CsSME_00016958 [Camellia sinensis var. sinensis]
MKNYTDRRREEASKTRERRRVCLRPIPASPLPRRRAVVPSPLLCSNRLKRI